MIPLERLRQRAVLKQSFRRLLVDHGILEVDVPVLGKTACPDPFVDPIIVEWKKQRCFLQPSPEFFLKRFLAQYPVDCYSLAPAFRDETLSPYHNPEFLMLELYLVGADRFSDLIQLTIKLADLVRPGDRICQMTYDECFEKYTGLPAEERTQERLLFELGDLVSDHWDRRSLEDYMFATRCQPFLGRGEKTILCGFPPEQAALARLVNGQAQRFEVFLEGTELANGYDELIDPLENEKRLKDWITQRADPFWPLDQHFLDAVRRLPPCSGVAFGLDRGLMLALEAQHLNEINLFTWDKI